jgi:Pyruvate/2-oxoacid:ferredoxin oxidoreductase gamma subunit
MNEGRYSQTWVAFGLDQTGVPNTAIVRISDEPIHQRASNITSPHYVVLLDATLSASITAGLRTDGVAIVPAGAVVAAKNAPTIIEAPTKGLQPDEARAFLVGVLVAASSTCSLEMIQQASAGLGDYAGNIAAGYQFGSKGQRLNGK